MSTQEDEQMIILGGDLPDIQCTTAEFEERWTSLIKFLESLKVTKYSQQKFKETEEKYSSEIQAIKNANSIIKPPVTPSANGNTWSYSIPSDILKMIFTEYTIRPDLLDKTVLNLILVCKRWRLFIYSFEDNIKFQRRLWYPLLNKFSFKKFEWKHLVLIPDKYLKLIYNVNRIQEMTIDECKKYRSLIIDNYDPNQDEVFVIDSNIPLLIQIIHKCPQLCSIQLSGKLCEDIFFEIGNLENLGHISFSYTTNAESSWIQNFIHEHCLINKSLESIHIERSYWIDDEAFWYFGQLKNLKSLYAEKPAISTDAVCDLFNNCINLESVEFHRAYFNEEDDLSEAFKILANSNNKSIEYIGFVNCYGINDKCLNYLMSSKVCTKLKELSVCYHTCTPQTISEFKEKRPNIDFNYD